MADPNVCKHLDISHVLALPSIFVPIENGCLFLGSAGAKYCLVNVKCNFSLIFKCIYAVRLFCKDNNKYAVFHSYNWPHDITLLNESLKPFLPQWPVVLSNH